MREGETMHDESDVGVHWSFWLIGAVGLVFSLLGCVNFISQMNAGNVASMPDAYRAMVEARPAWGTAAFAVAVFGAAFGCLLFLLRKSAALYLFILALAAAVAAQVPYIGMAGVPLGAWIGWLSQLVVVAFLAWYSKQAERQGWIS